MYVKLFDRLLSSSIWDADLPTRVAWVALLLMSDKDGNVYGTIPALARRANMTPDAMRAAMDVFTSPDPCSTTPDDDGRRVLNVSPNQWLIVNYQRYRDTKDADTIREQNRERARTYREKKRHAPSRSVTLRHARVTQDNAPSRHIDADVDTSADLRSPPANAEGSATASDVAVPAAPISTPKPVKPKVDLNRETWRIQGVTPEHVERWSRANPLVDVQADIAAAEAWCAANPDRAPRVRIEAFLVKWFSRSQERARKAVPTNNAAQPRQYAPAFKTARERAQEREAQENIERMRRFYDQYQPPGMPFDPDADPAEWKRAREEYDARQAAGGAA